MKIFRMVGVSICLSLSGFLPALSAFAVEPTGIAWQLARFQQSGFANLEDDELGALIFGVRQGNQEASRRVRELAPNQYVVLNVENVRALSDQNCAICHEALLSADPSSQEIVIRLNCPSGHLYHLECAEEAYQHDTRCPLCRGRVASQEN